MPGFSLVSYETRGGVRAGAVVEGRVFELAKLTGHADDDTISGLLADWERGHDRIVTALSRGAHSESVTLGEARLLAPVLYPGAIYCAGANYQDHADEMAAKAGRGPDPDPDGARDARRRLPGREARDPGRRREGRPGRRGGELDRDAHGPAREPAGGGAGDWRPARDPG